MASCCQCPVCALAARRFPADPPQLPIPVAIYPSIRPATLHGRQTPLKRKEAQP